MAGHKKTHSCFYYFVDILNYSKLIYFGTLCPRSRPHLPLPFPPFPSTPPPPRPPPPPPQLIKYS